MKYYYHGDFRYIETRQIKLFTKLTLFLCTVFLFTSCGSRVLIVSIVEESPSGTQATQVKTIEQSLVRGGQIVIDVKTARQIDQEFDNKFAVIEQDNKFIIRPALLNFIAANGWSFKHVSNLLLASPEYYFTKGY